MQKTLRKLTALFAVLTLAVGLTAGAGMVAAPPADAATATLAQWKKIAKCESGGRWSINTGNGYYGGLQFSLGTWKAYGGKGYPHRASKSKQIKIAKKVLARQGWGAWPSCSRKLGYR
ncbi:MAG: transglycosylase family protein [Arthrobacter sp.]|uniref:transglycosylase family protein n=1 Tax=Arthrobacter sp. TaxID=1667 RepID=UPI003487BF55